MKGEAKLPPSTLNVFNVQFHRLQKHKNKKARNESNKGNPYADCHSCAKFNPSGGFPNGQSPGERKADAGKPKGRQAECFEREGNPREP